MRWVRQGVRRPGFAAAVRVAVIGALLVLSLLLRPASAPLLVAGLFAASATVVEPLVSRLRTAPLAVGLPGFPASPPDQAARWVTTAAAVAVLLIAVPSLTGWGAWLALVGAVAHAVTVAASLLQRWRAYAARPASLAARRAALESYAPQFVLYTARRAGTYQLTMWLPYLEALGRPYVVVTRDPGALEVIGAVTSSPVVACPAWRDLDDVVVPSLRAAFYVNSVAANADFVTYRQLRHVYLGHGESDKALSSHPAHAMYDRVFVAGQAAARRYAANGVEIPQDKLVVVGVPQSEHIETATGPVPDQPTVLYAPTWAGYNEDSSYSSLKAGPRLVTALLERGATVVFRPHPFSRTRASERGHVDAVEELLAADAARTGRRHLWGLDEPFSASANRADAMVADLSSVVTEFLCSGKPFALVAPGDLAEFRASTPVAQAAYLVSADLDGLEGALDALLGLDDLADQRLRTREYYVGVGAVDEPRDAAFHRAVLALLDGPGTGSEADSQPVVSGR